MHVEIASGWKRLLRPLAKAIWLYLGLVGLREMLRLCGHYSMSATVQVADILKQDNQIWYWVAFLGGLAAYYEIALRIDGTTLWYMTKNVNVPLYRDMRQRAFSKFLDLPLKWHQRHNSAVLVGEVNNGVDRIEEIVNAAGWELAPLIGATVLSLVPLLWLSPMSALVVLIAAVIFLTLNYRIYRATEPLRVARCDAQREDWRLSSEYVRRLPAVLMANATARARAEYEQVQKEIAESTLEECRYEVFRQGRWRDRLMKWAQVALIGIWMQQLRTGRLTVVDCVYLWRICEDMFTYLEGYSGLLERFANSTEPVKRYFALLEEKIRRRRGALTLVGAEPYIPGNVELEFRDVTFRYDQERPCLEEVSLKVAAGEVVGIVGRSGSGKSTLAKLLCGLYQPQGGDIYVNKRSVRERWRAEDVRRLISYVPQLNDACVFERSIAENIRFAQPEASMAEVMDAARAAGLHDQVMRLPEQYETIVGESGCTLSGGQVQRLLIARELLKDAPVFILDEATSGQDVLTEAEILKSLMPRLKGKTVLLISHRLRAVRKVADKIAVMADGRISEFGTEQELVARRGLFYKMLGGTEPVKLQLVRRRGISTRKERSGPRAVRRPGDSEREIYRANRVRR